MSSITNTISDLIREGGIAQARGIANRGQILGNALSNIGQTIGSIPAQIQQRQQVGQQNELRALEMEKIRSEAARRKQADASQAQADSIIAGLPRNPDGTYDTGDFIQRLAAVKAPVEVQDHILKAIEGVNTSVQSLNKSKDEHIADAADALLALKKDAQPLSADTVHLGLAAMKGNLLSDAEVGKFTTMLSTGADPEAVLKKMRERGSKYKPDYQALPADSPGVLDKSTGTITPTGTQGRFKNETDLLAAAADPQHPQHDIAVGALKIKASNAKGSAEQDDQRYRNIQASLTQKQLVSPEDLAWAKGYEKQKTLGVDTSASAAADRQARAIGAQTAQQARAQGFQEGQVGRKELTDKVEQPYLDAREKAETLRSVIEAAKNGNMTAAAVQNLLGTLGIVTMEGVKRINTTELQQVGGAGSLLDRIKGRAGQMMAGQPMDAKLQSDLSDLSKLLERSARLKYDREFTAVTGRYGLKDEKPIEDPSAKSVTIAQVQAAATKRGTSYDDAKKFIESQGFTVTAK